MSTFLHSGCMGDLLYALPSIQALGGGHLFVCDRPWTKPLLHRVKTLIPLLLEQDCIDGISVYDPEIDCPNYDFTTFRNAGLKYGETIIARQARWVRAKIDISKPWLKANPVYAYPIIVARGERWHGFAFPWRQLVEQFGHDMGFVGLKTEYECFTREFGRIAYYPTSNMLDVANVIAGAELFIGSQSCPLAIAEGLHKRTIVEVCCWALDCIHQRPGNIHVINGNLDFQFRGHYFHHNASLLHLGKTERDLIERAENKRLELIHG